jgi:hypothetical protein
MIKTTAMSSGERYPSAEFLIHPECGCTSSVINQIETGQIPQESAHILSTSGMLDYARTATAQQFIVATEIGILHQLGKENPDKSFMPLRDDMICPYMKMITLEKLLNTLQNLVYDSRPHGPSRAFPYPCSSLLPSITQKEFSTNNSLVQKTGFCIIILVVADQRVGFKHGAHIRSTGY